MSTSKSTGCLSRQTNWHVVRIPINFASFFRELNIFEIKGRQNTLDTDAYYKGISYAGQLISQFVGRKNQYTRKNVTITFVSMSYRKRKMPCLAIS